jgi:hypothetical protein
MLDRQKGDIIFECDSCSAVFGDGNEQLRRGTQSAAARRVAVDQRSAKPGSIAATRAQRRGSSRMPQRKITLPAFEAQRSASLFAPNLQDGDAIGGIVVRIVD